MCHAYVTVVLGCSLYKYDRVGNTNLKNDSPKMIDDAIVLHFVLPTALTSLLLLNS